VDEGGDLALTQAECAGGLRVEDPLNHLHLDEVVAGSHRPELALPARAGALRDRTRVRTRQAAAGLGALEVIGRPDPVPFDEGSCPLPQHPVELRAAHLESPVPTHPGGNRARDLVHQRRPSFAQLRFVERQGQQPHTAVDVVADAAWRDHSVRRLGRGDPANGKAVALVDVGHRQRRPRHAGERADVLELLQ
jgi:hypothetical protein